MSNKPVKTFRHGAIGVSVWERQGKKGVFYDFTVSRSYKNGENGSAYASTFREDNAEAIVRVVGEAAAWIREQAGRNAQPDRASGGAKGQGSSGKEPAPTSEAAA